MQCYIISQETKKRH